jgi:hypothetical protein
MKKTLFKSIWHWNLLEHRLVANQEPDQKPTTVHPDVLNIKEFVTILKQPGPKEKAENA